MKNNMASAISRLANCGAGNWDFDSLRSHPAMQFVAAISLAPCYFSNQLILFNQKISILFFSGRNQLRRNNQFILIPVY